MICPAPEPQRIACITVAEARLILGPDARGLTDQQVADKIALWEVVADVVLEGLEGQPL